MTCFKLKVLNCFRTILVVCFIITATLTHAENTRKIKIARTIELQEAMETSLEETFNHLFANYTQKSSSFSKSFIYVCDNDCLNNMYGYGLTSAFLLAVLSERKFSIYPNKNTKFYWLYDENQYHWKRNESSLRNRRNLLMVPRSGNKHRQKTDLFLVERDLFNLNFDSFFKEDLIYHYGNEDWILDLRRHPKAAFISPWLYQAHSSDIVRLIHNGLFKVPKFGEMVKAKLIRQVGDKALVCFSGIVEARNQMNTFIDLYNKYFNTSKIFISGVYNLQSHIMAYAPEIGHQLVDIGTKDIDKHFVKHGMETRRLVQQAIDVYVLKMCHVLVLSENPSGILAAQLRRDERNIFCFRNGTIFPCTRKLIARSFNDVTNRPDYIDSKYFCRLSPKDCDPAK